MKRKRTSTSSSNIVNQVPTDILLSIFNNLSYIDDLVRAKAICSYWNFVGGEIISKMPLLMLPSEKEVEGGDSNNNVYNGFLNLGDNRVYSLKRTPKEFRESCCIGSSNGWLVFLGQKAVPFLYNPFRQIKIKLPSVDCLLGFKKMERNMDGEYELDYVNRFNSFKEPMFSLKFYGKQVRECFVQKAILTGKPDCKNESYSLVLLYNKGKEIAYHESGDINSWIALDVRHPPYEDIIFHENNLYALNNKSIIQVWDLQGGRIEKKSDIVLSSPDKSLEKGYSLRGPGSNRLYLVESCGDLLLVVRFIRDFMYRERTSIHNWERPSFHDRLFFCPYRTIWFHVYKMDLHERKWVETESLSDRALFFGGKSICFGLHSIFSQLRKQLYLLHR